MAQKVNEPDIEEGDELAVSWECPLAWVGWAEFFRRWAGKERYWKQGVPWCDRLLDGLLSFFGAFVSLCLLCWLHFHSDPLEGQLFVASFGASAVMIYAAPEAPMSQPWNFLFGHFISAFTGLCVRAAFDYNEDLRFVAAPLACSLTLFVQHIFLCVHPPGGATAMLVNVTPITTRWNGFWFLVAPVSLSLTVLFIIGLIVNNFARRRQYPHKWASFL
eukprot:TRINITY_DN3126_c0_g4_i1.p1 TRINITY_DN3126_c0_g4~~TRINITY_DN3126_c0_g4_i1.p1  ORF type:complete len:235 (+),score=25.04 TRINITY_DN3126_c0_g4_i1:53-706(+)